MARCCPSLDGVQANAYAGERPMRLYASKIPAIVDSIFHALVDSGDIEDYLLCSRCARYVERCVAAIQPAAPAGGAR